MISINEIFIGNTIKENEQEILIVDIFYKNKRKYAKIRFGDIERSIRVDSFKKNKHILKENVNTVVKLWSTHINKQNLKYKIIQTNPYVCEFENGDIVQCSYDSLYKNRIINPKEYSKNSIEKINKFLTKKPLILINKKINSITNDRLIIKCKKCNSCFDIRWNDLKQGRGCPFCSGKRVNETNSIYHNHKDILKYFKNKKEALNLTKGSSKKVDMICPDCNSLKKESPNRINRRGFKCSVCSDGISIPEKFISSLLKQLKIDFNREFIINKNNKYRYDFYLSNYNLIIEAHGEQHYEESNLFKSLDFQKANDLSKREYAMSNGIDTYLELDCKKSELNYLKSTFENNLCKIFDLKKLNYNQAWEDSQTSLVKLSWELFNKNKNIKEICDALNISPPTLRKYLKIGNDVGKCKYKTQ